VVEAVSIHCVILQLVAGDAVCVVTGFVTAPVEWFSRIVFVIANLTESRDFNECQREVGQATAI
jgi:hypothetical protein